MTISSHSRYTWLLGDYSVNPYSDARSTAFIVTSGGANTGMIWQTPCQQNKHWNFQKKLSRKAEKGVWYRCPVIFN